MKKLLLFIALLTHLASTAGSFTIHASVKDMKEDVISVYRYDDLFTMRTIFVTRELFGADGIATLKGDVTGTAKMQLRVGDRFADLLVRDGSDLRVELSPLPGIPSMNGTTQMGITFPELSSMDINALVSDVNERIDTFIAEDLATDEIGGMQAVDLQRKVDAPELDTTARPPTLFVTPVLSENKIDSFSMKLRRFYKDVNDPWFHRYVDNGLAGLQFGPRVNERSMYDRFIKDHDVLYDDPEYVRFIRNLYGESLSQASRYNSADLDRALAALVNDPNSSASMDSVVSIFRRNDLLKNEERLAQLIAMDQLYMNRHTKLVDHAEVEAFLKAIERHSQFPAHKAIAGNMLWDMLTMRNGTQLPSMRLENTAGKLVLLDSLLTGPVCIAFTASWCTACATEMAGLEQLKSEYPSAMQIIAISLDDDIADMNVYRRAHPGQNFIWLHAEAEQQLREDLRIRTLPLFLLLNDQNLARSPAPLPSAGLGAIFHQVQVDADKKNRVKVWDD